jgi:hypothetical protein
MAFNRLAPEDFVISSDSITATLWSEGTVALTNLTHHQLKKLVLLEIFT